MNLHGQTPTGSAADQLARNTAELMATTLDSGSGCSQGCELSDADLARNTSELLAATTMWLSWDSEEAA